MDKVPKDKMTILERIAKGSAIIFIATVITAILEYVYQVSMARFLSPNIFGILSVSLSIFWISAIILTSGVKISMAKFIAEDTNDGRVSSYLLNGALAQLILAAAFIIILLLVSLFVLLTTKYADLAMPLAVVSAILIPYTFFEISGATLQGLERMRGLGSIISLERGVKLAAAIFLVFLGYELFGALFAIFFSSLIAALFGFWMLRRYILTSRFDPDKEVMKKILFFSIPTAMITIFFTILLRSDVILLKFLLPQDTANIKAGYYTGSAVLARLIFYFSSAVPIALLPVVSSMHEKSGFELKDARKFIPLIIIVFVLINLLYLAFGYDLVETFFPPDYLKSAYVLPYLAFGISILSIDNIIATILIGMGKPKVVVKALSIGLAVYLGLVFMLVPVYGIMGTAWGMIGGSSTLLVLFLMVKHFRPKLKR